MLGSQVLETAIGLVLMFFVISLAASSAVEMLSRLLRKRSSNLEATLKLMLGPPGDEAGAAPADWTAFTRTSVYWSLMVAAGKSWGGIGSRYRRPSYVSARAFTDAVIELATADDGIDLSKLKGSLGARAAALSTEVKGDLTAIRAGIEQWFDETMERMAGAYKRWVSVLLLVLGFALAAAANASTYHVAGALWRDPVTRSVVVAAADDVLAQGAPADGAATDGAATGEEKTPLELVAETTEELQGLGLPAGWTGEAIDEWNDSTAAKARYLLGWLVTALLVSLGAPFWYDLLSRLMSLRSAGAKPPAAADDPTAATRQQAALVAAGYPPDRQRPR